MWVLWLYDFYSSPSLPTPLPSSLGPKAEEWFVHKITTTREGLSMCHDI